MVPFGSLFVGALDPGVAVSFLQFHLAGPRTWLKVLI